MTSRGRGRPRLGSSGDASDGARDRILVSARELFAERGFERTTMRAIGQRAEVDPALIHHCFGTKDRLMTSALLPDIDVIAVFDGFDPTANPGTEFVRRVVGEWEARPEVRDRLIALLRIAMTRDEVAAIMREFILGLAGTALGDVIRDDNRDLRFGLIASQMLGLGLTRYIFDIPAIAAAGADDLAASVGPRIEHYLLGDLGR